MLSSSAPPNAGGKRAVHTTRAAHRTPHRAAPRAPRVVVGRIHASWCGPCRELAPEWDKMEAALRPAGLGIALESVESEGAEAGIAEINRKYLAKSDQKLALASYPTIFTIDVGAGRLAYHEGDRSAAGLVEMARAAARAAGAKGGGRRRASRAGRRSRRGRSRARRI